MNSTHGGGDTLLRDLLRLFEHLLVEIAASDVEVDGIRDFMRIQQLFVCFLGALEIAQMK